MRHTWRLDKRARTWINRACNYFTLSVLLTVSGCSLPDIDISRKLTRYQEAGDGIFSKVDSQPHDKHEGDVTYLGTVRIRFTDSSLPPIVFDVRRQRSDMVSFNVMQTEKTSTYIHLGYVRGDGPTAGIRFRWRF